MRPSCAIHFPLVFPSPFIVAIVNEHCFFFFFFPLNKLSIEHVSASAQIFPFRWISRLVHYGGMEIAWNCRLRMQIGYTSVWNEPLSWWNHGELIRGQYCVKGFFIAFFLITELKGTSGEKKLDFKEFLLQSVRFECDEEKKKSSGQYFIFQFWNGMEEIVFENYRPGFIARVTSFYE